MTSYQEILAQLQNKQYKPVYFLYGNEPYFTDKITDYIANNTLTEAEKGFNQTIFYGRDTEIQSIIETAKRYPMMSEKQVVIIREAQDLKNLDALESYMEKPVESTIIVLAFKYKKPDGRKKIVKHMKANGVVFESKPIYDNQMDKWINDFIHFHKRKVSPKATMLVKEHIGTNLSLAENEINKLFITIPEGEMIDEDDVSNVIGINKDYNNFELQKAVGQLNFPRAMKIVNYFAQNQKEHPMVVTLSVLGKYYTNLMLLYFNPQASKQDIARLIGVNPFFVDEYLMAKSKNPANKVANTIELIRKYDAKSKGVGSGNTRGGELLKELIYKIIKN